MAFFRNNTLILECMVIVTIFTANDKLEARRKTYWYPSAHPIEFLEFTSKFQQFTLGTLNYNNSVHLQQLQSSYKLRQLQSRLKAFGQPSYNISHQMPKYLEDFHTSISN